MVEFVLGELQDRAISEGLPEIRVTARIHRLNHASQHLSRRWKFRHTEEFDEDYQIWAARLLLPTTEGGFIGGDAPFTSSLRR